MFYINFRTEIKPKRITATNDRSSNKNNDNNINFKRIKDQKQSKLIFKGSLISAQNDKTFKGTRGTIEAFKIDEQSRTEISGQSRDFLKDLKVIGQFDFKGILAQRNCKEFHEIWMFDQHACAERINLEKLIHENGTKINYNRDEMNMKACRSAVKFGDKLTKSEQEEILTKLSNCLEPFHCAHGRLTCWLLARIYRD